MPNAVPQHLSDPYQQQQQQQQQQHPHQPIIDQQY